MLHATEELHHLPITCNISISGGCLACTRTSGLECSSSAAKVFYLKACALLEEKATVLYPSHFAFLFSVGWYPANFLLIVCRWTLSLTLIFPRYGEHEVRPIRTGLVPYVTAVLEDDFPAKAQTKADTVRSGTFQWLDSSKPAK